MQTPCQCTLILDVRVMFLLSDLWCYGYAMQNIFTVYTQRTRKQTFDYTALNFSVLIIMYVDGNS